ncbi:MAG: DUF4401 domain-containing protein [Alphaproteobacteria bacterium]
MAEYQTKLNAKNLLAAWEDAGHITEQDRRKLGASIFSRHQEEELPIYLRILVGIGAFIASACIIGFLTLTKIIDFDSTAELTGWGGLFIVNAVLLARRAAASGVMLHSFLMNISFCSIGIGKILAVAGALALFKGSHHNEGWAIAYALAAVTAVTWPFYRMSIDRFLSSVGVLLLLLVNIIIDRDLAHVQQYYLDGFFLLNLCAVIALFTSGRVPKDYAPLGYAFIVSLCATVAYFTITHKYNWFFHMDKVDPTFVTVSLAAALIGLIGWAAGDMKRLKKEPLLFAAIGVTALGAMSAPGIILAVALMVLGYARHERLLILAGVLLMPAFLWLFYYSLDLTLMAKSGILVCSGLVLLAGRVYMHAQKFDREAIT